MQFVSHLFCFPSIRRKGALRPPRRKCPCEGLWVHRGSCRFNLPDQSFPFPPRTVRALNVITRVHRDFISFILGEGERTTALCKMSPFCICHVIVPCLLPADSSQGRSSEDGNKKQSETFPAALLIEESLHLR